MNIPRTRPRVVFDCNISVQAAAFEDGPAAECLRLMESGAVELFVSKPTIAELRRVFTYEEVLSISPNLTPERVSAFVKRVTVRATRLRRVPRVFNYPRDPKDVFYMDLAATARADYLVTRDNDLLSLMSGHSAICKAFRRRTHPLLVVDPTTFLEKIRYDPNL